MDSETLVDLGKQSLVARKGMGQDPLAPKVAALAAPAGGIRDSNSPGAPPPRKLPRAQSGHLAPGTGPFHR